MNMEDGNPELTGLETQDRPKYGSMSGSTTDDGKSNVTLATSSPSFIPSSFRGTTSYLKWHDSKKGLSSQDPATSSLLHRATVWVSLLIGAFAVLGIKVAAFSICGSQMVKTTMFGSCGDALSGAILILTQTNSRRNDVTKFPAGKGRFEPLGVLVFSVFLASLMTNQVLTACWHIAAVDESDAKAGMQMLWKGHPPNVYTPTPFGGAAGVYSVLHDVINRVKEDQKQTFLANYEALGIDWNLVEMAPEKRDQAMSTIMDGIGELVSIGDVDGITQRYQSVCTLLIAVLIIKAMLGIFCRYFVYPRTRSFMMVALAYDHFYDAIAQVFVMLVTTVSFVWRGKLGWFETRLDAFCSIIFAASIIAHWVVIVVEQLTYLSGYAADPAYYEDIARVAKATLTSEDIKCELDAVKAYHFGRRHLVELDIVVPDSSVPYIKVKEMVESVKQSVGEVDDVEKVFVNTAIGKGSYS